MAVIASKSNLRQQRQGEQKRRAAASPQNSPESKSKQKKKRGRPSKQISVATRDGDRLHFAGDDERSDIARPAVPKRRGRPSRRPIIPLHASDSLDMSGDEDVFGLDSPTPAQARPAFTRQSLHALRSESREREGTSPHPSQRGPAKDGILHLPVPTGALSAVLGMSRQPPLMNGRHLSGIANGTRHAPTAQEQNRHQGQLEGGKQLANYDGTTQDLLQRQRQSAKNIVLMQQHMSGHGAGGYPAPVMSDTRSSINLGQNSFDAVTQSKTGNFCRRSGLHSGFSIHEDPAHDPFSDIGFAGFDHSVSGSRLPSRQGPFANGQLSAPGSRIMSRQPSLDHLDIPLQGIGSRFPSRTASLDHHRPTFQRIAPGNHDLQDDDNIVDHDETKLAISSVVPRELNQRLAIPTTIPPQPYDPLNPTIRLRISSNTYDPTGALIFSILTIGMHDPFGPRLEYYCTQRGKRLGIDWKIIFKYPAPTHSKPSRQKYFDLEYHTTPHQCFDKEYSASRLQDGDTLLVCRRRTIADNSDHNELGTQLTVQRIDIEDGERTIFQGHDINLAWYRDIDTQLSDSKKQIAHLQAIVERYENSNTVNRDHARTLELENQKLKRQVLEGENEILRVQLAAASAAQGGFVQPYLPLPQAAVPQHAQGVVQDIDQEYRERIALQEQESDERIMRLYREREHGAEEGEQLHSPHGYQPVQPPVRVEDGEGEEEEE